MDSEKKRKINDLSIDELRSAVQEQAQEINRMRAYINQVGANMMMKRLDYLFKILESSAVFDDEIVDIASNEIIELMWPNDEEEKGEEEGEESVDEGVKENG